MRPSGPPEAEPTSAAVREEIRDLARWLELDVTCLHERQPAPRTAYQQGVSGHPAFRTCPGQGWRIIVSAGQSQRTDVVIDRCGKQVPLTDPARADPALPLGQLTPYRRRVHARAGRATNSCLTRPSSLWQRHAAYLCGVRCYDPRPGVADQLVDVRLTHLGRAGKEWEDGRSAPSQPGQR